MRAAIKIVLPALLALAPSASSHSSNALRPLSFEQRVAAQAAIERVYFSHRNGTTKSFEEAVRRDVLENDVRNYLAQSAALEQLWNRPVTGEMLRQEVERMARSTSFPGRLRELFSALGNDGFLVQECLARPILVNRLARQAFAYDEKIHEKAVLDEEPGRVRVATYSERRRSWDDWWSDAAASFDGRSVKTSARADISRPVVSVPKRACPDWAPTAMGADAPTPRAHHGAVWTGSEMIVWGGVGTTPLYYLNSGGRYDPATDSWRSTNTTDPDLPSARAYHAAVWTGTEMIVWGGSDDAPLNSGGRYDPATDSWEPTNVTDPDLPGARSNPAAVWTGREMIVWGGSGPTPPHNLTSGGRYDPATDSWEPTNATDPDLPGPRSGFTAVWTGTEMIVWGGFVGRPYYEPTWFYTGGRYNPLTDRWTATSVVGTPGARRRHTAVWTGREMVVWGGDSSDGELASGRRYDPASDSWTDTVRRNVLVARDDHTAIWTGREMIVWGGSGDGDMTAGGRYDPLTDRWTPTAVTPATPTRRKYHTAVWTGREMIVWGGDAGDYTNSGGRYRADPASCGRPLFAFPPP